MISFNLYLSTINSIHIVNSHLEDWYDLHQDSLVKVSDHTVESCHQSFEKTLRRGNFWVNDVTSDIGVMKSRPFFFFCVTRLFQVEVLRNAKKNRENARLKTVQKCARRYVFPIAIYFE